MLTIFGPLLTILGIFLFVLFSLYERVTLKRYPSLSSVPEENIF